MWLLIKTAHEEKSRVVQRQMCCCCWNHYVGKGWTCTPCYKIALLLCSLRQVKQSSLFGINTVQKLLQVCMADVLQFRWLETVVLADMELAIHTELGTVNLDAR